MAVVIRPSVQGWLQGPGQRDGGLPESAGGLGKVDDEAERMRGLGVPIEHSLDPARKPQGRDEAGQWAKAQWRKGQG